MSWDIELKGINLINNKDINKKSFAEIEEQKLYKNMGGLTALTHEWLEQMFEKYDLLEFDCREKFFELDKTQVYFLNEILEITIRRTFRKLGIKYYIRQEFKMNKNATKEDLNDFFELSDLIRIWEFINEFKIRRRKANSGKRERKFNQIRPSRKSGGLSNEKINKIK